MIVGTVLTGEVESRLTGEVGNEEIDEGFGEEGGEEIRSVEDGGSFSGGEVGKAAESFGLAGEDGTEEVVVWVGLVTGEDGTEALLIGEVGTEDKPVVGS